MIHTRGAKAVFALILICGMLAIVGANAYAAQINDIAKSSGYARAVILALADKGIISGDDKGNFNPQGTVTRAQMVKIIVTALGLNTEDVPAVPTFKDVPKESWAYKYIETAYQKGIINGVSVNEFGINQPCNREQMAVIFVRSLGLFFDEKGTGMGYENLDKMLDKGKVSGFSKSYVEFAISSGLMTGTGSNTFSPGGNALREQAAVLTERLLDNKESILSKSKEYQEKYGRKPQVAVNGDILHLKASPVLQNGEVLIPYDALADAGVSCNLNEESGVIFAERGWIKDNANQHKSIYMKIGRTDAYKNVSDYLTDPYSGDAAPKDKLITLAAAPVKINGTVFVPARQLAQELGFEVKWDNHSYILTLASSSVRSYPNLNKAVMDHYFYSPLFGGFKMDMEINLKNLDNDKFININHTMDGFFNNDKNAHDTPGDNTIPYVTNINSKISAVSNSLLYSSPDSKTLDSKYSALGSKIDYSMKDLSTGNWVTKSPDQFRGIDFLKGSVRDIVYPPVKIIDIAAAFDLPVKKADKVSVNGQTLTRYTVTLENADALSKYFNYQTRTNFLCSVTQAPFPRLDNIDGFYMSAWYQSAKDAYRMDKIQLSVFLDDNDKIARVETQYSGVKFKSVMDYNDGSRVNSDISFRVSTGVDFD